MDRAAKESVKNAVDVLLWGAIVAFLIASAFFVFFKFTPYKLVNIHGPSMEPTLSNGDLIVLKTTDDILRDQIAVFSLPDSWTTEVLEPARSSLIKRVVGLPGDSVIFNGDSVKISSRSETYSLVEPKIIGCPLKLGDRLTVPEDSYFLAGDNRVQSFDSMSAWCAGLDPFVSKDTIGINGELKLQLGIF